MIKDFYYIEPENYSLHHEPYVPPQETPLSKAIQEAISLADWLCAIKDAVFFSVSYGEQIIDILAKKNSGAIRIIFRSPIALELATAISLEITEACPRPVNILIQPVAEIPEAQPVLHTNFKVHRCP